MKVQVSAWKDHDIGWKDNANFWQSKYWHQNRYPQILVNANKVYVPRQKPYGQITRIDRVFTSISGNVITPRDVRALRDAKEATKTRDREAIDARVSQAAQKALNTVRAQNYVGQAHATTYPADASPALAAQKAQEREKFRLVKWQQLAPNPPTRQNARMKVRGLE
ncbi:hypothetical protein K3495_g11051 [Podosphaera aphanis]|nr:hypothetical protein K3495_g11051 [Podosphaera aphanis]